MKDKEEEKIECLKPCDPNNACEDCTEYWARMIEEGYWDSDHHRWTDKGWREITK